VVRFPEEAGKGFLIVAITGAHPASYPMGMEGSIPGSKVAGAWNWPLPSTYCRG